MFALLSDFSSQNPTCIGMVLPRDQEFSCLGIWNFLVAVNYKFRELSTLTLESQKFFSFFAKIYFFAGVLNTLSASLFVLIDEVDHSY